jgi:hypothetical protein
MKPHESATGISQQTARGLKMVQSAVVGSTRAL